MKNVIKVLFLVFSFFILSCDNQDKTINDNDLKSNFLSEKEIINIGERHNKALAGVLDKIKKDGISFKNRKKSEIIEITNKGLNEYYATQYNGENLESTILFSEKIISECKNSIKTRAGNDNLSFGQFRSENNLSDKQVELLLQIGEILERKSDLQSILVDLEKLNNDAKKNLSAEEAQIILITTSVAIKSCNYWNENIEEWIEVLTNEKRVKTRASWFSWGAVVKGDAIGATTGAIGAAAVNAMPGAGQVAYGGAIVGAAAAGSSYEALNQIWEHYDISSWIDGVISEKK